MKTSQNTESPSHTDLLQGFTLLGGPLYKISQRLRLLGETTNGFSLGLAIGLSLWLPLFGLAVFEELTHHLFSVAILGAHVRLLVAIPLFFFCEALVSRRVGDFVRFLVSSEIVPPQEVPSLRREITRIVRWKDFWIPDFACLIAATAMSLWAAQLPLFGGTTVYDPSRAIAAGSMAADWYWYICLTAFRFLVFRWVWHIALWWIFLWRLSRLRLHLVPTHPDGVAGLGYLELVQGYFAPLTFAISAIQAASLTEDLASNQAVFEDIYSLFGFTILVNAILLFGPPSVFIRQLWRCYEMGMARYMQLGATYVTNFERQVIAASPDDKRPPGTDDVQSLADMMSSVDVVRSMRVVLINRGLILTLVISTIVPLLPLSLFKYPAAELMEKFVKTLTGF